MDPSCLFIRYTSNSDYLTTDDLLLFLEAEQGVGKIGVCEKITCHYFYRCISKFSSFVPLCWKKGPANNNNNEDHDYPLEPQTPDWIQHY